MTASQGSPNGKSILELIHACDDLQFQVEKFLKWVSEPVNEEAPQEAASQDNVQDTCTSSDSEEQEPSVNTGGDLLATSQQGPEKCQAVCAAGEPETANNEGESTVTALTDEEDCATRITPDSLQADAAGKTRYASTR